MSSNDLAGQAGGDVSVDMGDQNEYPNLANNERAIHSGTLLRRQSVINEVNPLFYKRNNKQTTPISKATNNEASPLPPPPATAATISSSKTEHRDFKTTVHVRVVFAKVGEIDTVKETFGADLYVQYRWREPDLDGAEPDDLEKVDFKKLWNPRLYIENEIADKKSVITNRAYLNDKGEAYISEWRKMRGDFLETLELQNFPLDVQDLSVTLISELREAEVDLVLEDRKPSLVNVETFVDVQEWHLYQHISVTKKTFIEFAQEKKHSIIRFTCQAARRPGFFFYNVFLVMFFITCLSFGTFSVDCSQSRLGLTFTLVLTTVAYKIAIGNSLPKISYLTFAEKYVVLSLFFLVIICAWHSIASVVPYLCYDKTSRFYTWKSEQWVVLGFFGLDVFGHVMLIGNVFVAVWRKRLETIKRDREFREHKKIHYDILP